MGVLERKILPMSQDKTKHRNALLILACKDFSMDILDLTHLNSCECRKQVYLLKYYYS
jgi:hypothetical protein